MIPDMPAQMGPTMPLWLIVVYIVLYVFFAYCLARMAVKTGRAFGSSFILAIIPIANIYLLFKMAGKPGWWLILMLVPIVNVVMLIIAWIEIMRKLGYPGWWVILLFIPVVNLIIFLILAFGKGAQQATA
jgi:hypothetical protein